MSKDKYSLARDRISKSIESLLEFSKCYDRECEFMISESTYMMTDLGCIQDISKRSHEIDIEILFHMRDNIDRLIDANTKQQNILKQLKLWKIDISEILEIVNG
jgi:hypothetical protein